MTKEVQKWADPAMFAAQPQEEHGPKVQLLSCTPDPLGTIAAVAHAYQGKFHESLAEITDDERRYFLDDVRKNVLAAPLEFVHFHFRITGVTRGFTHQMVRQRTACYAQESTRFAVKESVPVALPPSLIGTVPWMDWVASQKEMFGIPDENWAQEKATQQQLWRKAWDHAVGTIEKVYNDLVNSGMPAEDARGLLPTNLLTQLNYTTSLRHLIDHAGLRLCTQAQFEWRLVWVEILKAIRGYHPEYSVTLTEADIQRMTPGWSVGAVYHGMDANWQFQEIADLFKPICYKTGKCEFMSDGDRYCSIRERVNAFHDNGIKPQHWGEGANYQQDGVLIAGINDPEWLADPKAARR